VCAAREPSCPALSLTLVWGAGIVAYGNERTRLDGAEALRQVRGCPVKHRGEWL
jgi:hypothetical protein